MRIAPTNSLKGSYIADHIEDYYRGYQGDARSLDYSHSVQTSFASQPSASCKACSSC